MELHRNSFTKRFGTFPALALHWALELVVIYLNLND